MEGVANSVEDKLIDGLSFKHKPGASYITDRKSVTFHPSGSNFYSTNGTKLIKIVLTGDQWLDPSTLRIMFDLSNTSGVTQRKLRPLGGPHSFFRRMRILCGGQVIEDIDSYNRVHEMLRILKAQDANINADAEAFGQQYDKYTTLDTTTLDGIRNGEFHTVLFKPCSGLFSQSKMLPIRYCPITIELELVNDPNDPIVSNSTPDTGGVSGSGFDISAGGNTSTSWALQNVQVKCDVVTLDNQLDNSYAEHLLSGKKLPINYQTYISQMQSILSGTNGQQKVRLNVTRALSRLKNVFITLDNDVPSGNLNDVVKYKKWNSFYSPYESYAGATLNSFDKRGEFEAMVQVGSKKFPETEIRSHQEAYYQLRKTLGSHDQHNSIDITQHEYKTRKFVLGFDMEKVLEAGFTGTNTRQGDIMSVTFNHNQNENGANWAKEMQIVLTSDQIMEIADSGVVVFD